MHAVTTRAARAPPPCCAGRRRGERARGPERAAAEGHPRPVACHGARSPPCKRHLPRWLADDLVNESIGHGGTGIEVASMLQVSHHLRVGLAGVLGQGARRTGAASAEPPCGLSGAAPRGRCCSSFPAPWRASAAGVPPCSRPTGGATSPSASWLRVIPVRAGRGSARPGVGSRTSRGNHN